MLRGMLNRLKLGSMDFAGRTVLFDHGRSYLLKDWGLQWEKGTKAALNESPGAV